MSASEATQKGDESTKIQVKIGDRTTSDVVVRLRTVEGRDDWLYCHSNILKDKSKYFADRLSNNWPTCQILDSRFCVEIFCQELDFNFHVSTLRLLYIPDHQTWHGVRNALGILQVAIHLGCPQISHACMEYLEAVPWEEAEEEEILRTIPHLGPQYERILARVQPVNKTALVEIFLSSVCFATSSPPVSMGELKKSTQDQLEYMLTEDDDAPLITSDDGFVKSEVRKSVKNLFARFISKVEEVLKEDNTEHEDLKSLVYDISWVCQILNKMEMMKDLVHPWVDLSTKIVGVAETEDLEVKLKIAEIASKVLEAIGFGNAILPKSKRLTVIRVWLPYVQKLRAEYDKEDTTVKNNVDSEMWQLLESGFVTIILTFPLADQAEILSVWLRCQHIGFPDLTEAFEVWCYRSKVAKKRMAMIGGMSIVEKSES